MILIAHRGNMHGPNPKVENFPEYIDNALRAGYNVEIDVWLNKGHFFLGHNGPHYKTSLKMLQKKGVWVHAKNLDALEALLPNKRVNCFWHQEDDYTITSRGHLWTYPRKPICPSSVIVCQTLEETLAMTGEKIKGICSDYVGDLE